MESVESVNGVRYRLVGDDDEVSWLSAVDATGLFEPVSADQGERRVEFLGCVVEGALLRGMERVGTRHAESSRARSALAVPLPWGDGTFFDVVLEILAGRKV